MTISSSSAVDNLSSPQEKWLANTYSFSETGPKFVEFCLATILANFSHAGENTLSISRRLYGASSGRMECETLQRSASRGWLHIGVVGDHW